MKSVWVHAGLLAVALPVAYFTWTRDPAEMAKQGATLIWNEKVKDITAVEVHDRVKDVRIDPRHDDGDYLWGTRTYHITTAADSLANSQLVALPDSLGFLIADIDGKAVMEMVAAPSAMRDLGVVSDSLAKEFGFTADTTLVRVALPNAVREFLVGGHVFGSEDRYVMRLSDRSVFAVPGLNLTTLLGGDLTLSDRRFHVYTKDKIASLKITTPKGSKTYTALSQLGSTIQYAPSDSVANVDIPFSNLMGQMDDSGITSYRPEIDPATLKQVMRADYLAADGSALGFIELLERPGKDGKPEYFARTEHSKVVVQSYQEVGEMMRNNLDRLF